LGGWGKNEFLIQNTAGLIKKLNGTLFFYEKRQCFMTKTGETGRKE
jgi:hypothetical protein